LSRDLKELSLALRHDSLTLGMAMAASTETTMMTINSSTKVKARFPIILKAKE
jgi:hypothetical protein